jgi:hypothetical protein
MPPPKITRPHFPKGYVDKPKKLLAWSEVEGQLSTAIHYWLCSVRPNSRPHVIPKWGVWVNGRFYFDGSPETRHARNLADNPHVAVHLESGEKAVILEGTAREVSHPAPELAAKVAQVYKAKYAALGYAPQPDQWDNGGLFEIVPHTVIAWTNFTEDPTKFIFE